MFKSFDELATKGSLVVIILSILSIFVSGIFFGITYFVMEEVEDAFLLTDCDIADNVYVDNCQELWALSIYPFLALRELLIWISFFFIFAMVLGMLVLGYKAGKSSLLMGLLVVFIIVLTYGALEISNIYRSMLEIDAFRVMMVEFTAYNGIMFNFPWFVFIVGFMSIMLSLVNYQRSKVNSPAEDLDY